MIIIRFPPGNTEKMQSHAEGLRAANQTQDLVAKKQHCWPPRSTTGQQANNPIYFWWKQRQLCLFLYGGPCLSCNECTKIRQLINASFGSQSRHSEHANYRDMLTSVTWPYNCITPFFRYSVDMCCLSNINSILMHRQSMLIFCVFVSPILLLNYFALYVSSGFKEVVN